MCRASLVFVERPASASRLAGLVDSHPVPAPQTYRTVKMGTPTIPKGPKIEWPGPPGAAVRHRRAKDDQVVGGRLLSADASVKRPPHTAPASSLRSAVPVCSSTGGYRRLTKTPVWHIELTRKRPNEGTHWALTEVANAAGAQSGALRWNAQQALSGRAANASGSCPL